MIARFTLFRRGETFYCEDTTTGKQTSLRTKDRAEAATLLQAKNEAARQPFLNLRIAQTYLAASDTGLSTRTWQTVMDEFTGTKLGANQIRCKRAMEEKAFDLIRTCKVIETQPEHLLRVLKAGGVSTNNYLRRLHNFALGMNWLSWPILPKKQWPSIRHKEKRGVSREEHRQILARESNDERRAGANVTFAARASVALMNIGAGTSLANSGVSIQITHPGGLYVQFFSFLGADRSLSQSTANPIVTEGGTVLRYTVSRPATGSAITVPIVFSGLAQSGGDFTATTLNLGVSQSSGFVDITPLNDALVEGWELLGVQIDPADTSVAGSNGRQAALIRDASGNPEYMPERDYDADGLTDRQEIARGSDPFVFNDTGLDTDNDGLAEFQEVNAGSNPAVADSDGSGDKKLGLQTAV